MAQEKAMGEVVWRDLMSLDVERSRDFFQAVFGWEIEEWRMPTGDVYQMFKQGEKTFGGVVPLDKEHGMSSHWISYHKVDDVDERCARATDLGATIGVEPTDIPDIGRFAVVGDPQGAWFSLFSSSNPDGVDDPAAGAHGSVTWTELQTSDPDAATNFYSRLFELSTETVEMEYGPYTTLKAGETMIGGIGRKPEELPVSAWVTYFETSDVDKTIAEIEQLGGTVTAPAMDIPGVGRIGWAVDPAGTSFAFMTSESQG